MLFIIRIYKRNNPLDVEEAIDELKTFYYKKEEIIGSKKVIGWKLETFNWENFKFMQKLLNEAKIEYWQTSELMDY